MNGNKTLVANFERKAFVLDTTVTGNGQIVTNLLSGTETEGGFLFESEVEITAVPFENWNFVRWEGDVESTDNPITVTMDQDISLVAVFSIFDGGDGSDENPYQISTVLQLQEIQNHLDSHFIQTTDIDATETENWNNEEGFEPIGDDEDSFEGSYNGNGFEIQGLTINRPLEFAVGLFGYINGGVVQNLTMQNAIITGNERVGGLVGINEGVIDSVAVEGTIQSDIIAGGVAGRNVGFIRNSEATIEISGQQEIGGIAGINSGNISNSFASATIANVESDAGGFVGRNSGRIDESYAIGFVEGTNSIGGFAGVNSTGGIITNSYSLASVTGDDTVGGFIGDNNTATEVEFSFSSGVVTGNSNTGGFIGAHSSQSALLNGTYWDVDNSGFTDGIGDGPTDGLIGLETAEMNGAVAETNMPAFNWENIWITSESYPVLQWQTEE
jgi:hypothetical protein